MVSNVTDEEMQEHYDNFFEDVFVECEDKVKICIFNILSNYWLGEVEVNEMGYVSVKLCYALWNF